MQRDMLRVQENLRAQAPGAQQFGIAPGLVRPTGGLFGTAIGATPSLDEIIGDEFERLKPGGPTGAFTAFDEGVRGFFDDLMGRPNTAGLRTTAQNEYIDTINKELAQAGGTAWLRWAGATSGRHHSRGRHPGQRTRSTGGQQPRGCRACWCGRVHRCQRQDHHRSQPAGGHHQGLGRLPRGAVWA